MVQSRFAANGDTRIHYLDSGGPDHGAPIVFVPGMTDVAALTENAPYILLIFASLVIGFMPFLLIHLVEPSVSILPFMPPPK